MKRKKCFALILFAKHIQAPPLKDKFCCIIGEKASCSTFSLCSPMSYNLIIAVAAHAMVAYLDNLFHLAHYHVCGYTMHTIKSVHVVKLPLNHMTCTMCFSFVFKVLNRACLESGPVHFCSTYLLQRVRQLRRWRCVGEQPLCKGADKTPEFLQIRKKTEAPHLIGGVCW